MNLAIVTESALSERERSISHISKGVTWMGKQEHTYFLERADWQQICVNVQNKIIFLR